VLSVAYIWLTNSLEESPIDYAANFWASFCAVAILGHYSCCNGDTWSSELGILSKGKPRHILTWKKVPPGTNGGVSLLGFGASALGGLFVGLVYASVSWVFVQLPRPLALKQCGFILIVSAATGLLGSVVDSVMGATLQYSGWSSKQECVVSRPSPTVKRISGIVLLSNNDVNFLSSLLTAMVSGYFGKFIF